MTKSLPTVQSTQILTARGSAFVSGPAGTGRNCRGLARRYTLRGVSC